MEKFKISWQAVWVKNTKEQIAYLFLLLLSLFLAFSFLSFLFLSFAFLFFLLAFSLGFIFLRWAWWIRAVIGVFGTFRFWNFAQLQNKTCLDDHFHLNTTEESRPPFWENNIICNSCYLSIVFRGFRNSSFAAGRESLLTYIIFTRVWFITNIRFIINKGGFLYYIRVWYWCSCFTIFSSFIWKIANSF